MAEFEFRVLSLKCVEEKKALKNLYHENLYQENVLIGRFFDK